MSATLKIHSGAGLLAFLEEVTKEGSAVQKAVTGVFVIFSGWALWVIRHRRIMGSVSAKGSTFK